MHGLAETASTPAYSSGLALHHAVLTGQLGDVKFLVEENNYNPMQRDDQGMNAVHVAALAGNLQVMKYLITERDCNPACPGPLGLAPLHLASEQGHLDMVKYLVIEQQIDPLCEDEYGNTALHRACAGGSRAVVELLAEEHEKYNPITQVISEFRDKWNGTPLHAAVRYGHLNIVQFFISEKNCDPNVRGSLAHRLPVHAAAQFGHLPIVKYLIDEQSCDPSCLDDRKYTPIHCAAMQVCMDT